MIVEEIKPSQLVGQAAEFMFESNLEPLPDIWQSHFQRLFQKEIKLEGFKKIYGRALGDVRRAWNHVLIQRRAIAQCWINSYWTSENAQSDSSRNASSICLFFACFAWHMDQVRALAAEINDDSDEAVLRAAIQIQQKAVALADWKLRQNSLFSPKSKKGQQIFVLLNKRIK